MKTPSSVRCERDGTVFEASIQEAWQDDEVFYIDCPTCNRGYYLEMRDGRLVWNSDRDLTILTYKEDEEDGTQGAS